MILMVSGRTDIINYYTKWFINRLKSGFVDVRNPINPKLVSRIYFSDVDLIYFCTKDPRPIIPYLKEINIPYIFNVTLTPYHNDIEKNVGNKLEIIEAIKYISKEIGIDNIYLRYDPILLNTRYDIAYHIKAFNKLTDLLDGYVNKYIISFIDDYKNVRKHLNELNLKEITLDDIAQIGINFSEIAKRHNATCQTCAEPIDMTKYGFVKGECINIKDVYRLTNKINFKTQQIRKGKCECLNTVDIGAYNTCHNRCLYCYANYDEDMINKNINDPNSSLLIGHIEPDDVIKRRIK